MSKKADTNIKELEDRINDLDAQLKRAVADYHNLEKRVAEGRSELTSWGTNELVKKLLPVLDHLERALEGASDEEKQSGWYKGVEMAVKEFKNVLQGEGLEEIIVEGEFNPALQEAVDTREPSSAEASEGKGENSILEIVQKGYFSPGLTPVEDLKSGEIGYIATGIKQSDLVRVGDTISHITISHIGGVIQPLPGYKEVKPMVYVGLYPIEQSEFLELKEVLNKFRLTDPAFTYVPENSQALGAGFRCGFLGLLHAEVVQQRLSEEFNIDLLATTPSVEYLVGGKAITNPADFDMGDPSINSGQVLKNLKEPWVKLRIFTPQDFIGGIMDLVSEKRGIFQNQTYFGTQVELLYEMPLSEMITDFYDKLKSVSSGFASLDWDFLEFREIDAVRVDILVGGEKVDALSTIIVRSRAESVGRRLVGKLKDVLPRQNFEIALQAIVGGKIIARETISPFKKDVLMHGSKVVGGGDYSRKRKLLEKQKKGKKKMKMIGRVEIPQEAFLSILKS